MLPGLRTLLESIPTKHRYGWVANPLLIDGKERNEGLLRPTPGDLVVLIREYSNNSIARAFDVSETAVRKWLVKAKIHRDGNPGRPSDELSASEIQRLQRRAEEVFALPSYPTESRLTTEHVGKIISKIGEKARIIVQQPDDKNGRRIKFASAHDLRRSCAHRLINAGVSAETLKILLRHDDFKTTEKFYGAVREAQAASQELHEKLSAIKKRPEQDGQELLSKLSVHQIRKLQALLNAI